MNDTHERPEELIERNREALEDLAESDLPVNWIAQELLGVADE